MAAIAKAYPGAASLEKLAEAIAAQHDIPEIKPQYAQRGDVALIEIGGRQSLAIVHLNGRQVVATGAKGLHVLKLRLVKRAWRIGALTPGAHIQEGDGRLRFAPPDNTEALARLRAGTAGPKA
jgi:hypothetical protein